MLVCGCGCCGEERRLCDGADREERKEVSEWRDLNRGSVTGSVTVSVAVCERAMLHRKSPTTHAGGP